jgi:hypothetical protein
MHLTRLLQPPRLISGFLPLPRGGIDNVRILSREFQLGDLHHLVGEGVGLLAGLLESVDHRPVSAHRTCDGGARSAECGERKRTEDLVQSAGQGTSTCGGRRYRYPLSASALSTELDAVPNGDLLVLVVATHRHSKEEAQVLQQCRLRVRLRLDSHGAS